MNEWKRGMKNPSVMHISWWWEEVRCMYFYPPHTLPSTVIARNSSSLLYKARLVIHGENEHRNKEQQHIIKSSLNKRVSSTRLPTAFYWETTEPVKEREDSRAAGLSMHFVYPTFVMKTRGTCVTRTHCAWIMYDSVRLNMEMKFSWDVSFFLYET